MGYTGALFGSELFVRDNEIGELMHHVSFRDIDAVYISDHYDRSKYVPDANMKKISLFDGTLLAFVDPDKVILKEYDQLGSINGTPDDFEYVNEVFFGPNDRFCIFFMILPMSYYPKRFFAPDNPHFAARVGNKIRITWWFKESIQIKLRIKLDAKQFNKFDYIDSATLTEKHPNAVAAYREVERLAAATIGETFSP